MQAFRLVTGSAARRRYTVVLSLVLLGLSLAAPTYASDIGTADTGAAKQGFAALEGMRPEEMQNARGSGGGVGWGNDNVNVQSIQEMDASVSNVSFTVGGDIITGDISLDSEAIGNYHGVGIFNLITGNANAVNSAVGISIYIAK